MIVMATHASAAEKDKCFFENKLSASVVALDNLHDQMKALSLNLESSDETIRKCKLLCCHFDVEILLNSYCH